MSAYTKARQLQRGPSRKQSRVQDRAVYRQVTESARNAEGFLVCDLCGKPGRDEEMVRDHRRTRGSGGKTTATNVRILHVTCHTQRHQGGFDDIPLPTTPPRLPTEEEIRLSKTAADNYMRYEAHEDREPEHWDDSKAI